MDFDNSLIITGGVAASQLAVSGKHVAAKAD